MGDGTKENPYTRSDVLRLIKENGGTAKGLNLSGKIFEEAIDLSDLDLSGSILKNAYFPPIVEMDNSQANMQKQEIPIVKKIIGANLQRVNLSYADLQGAMLSHSNLKNTSLFGAIMKNAFFAGCNLQETDLSGADLDNTCMRNAKLQNSMFLNTMISQTTDLEGIDWGNYVLWEKGIYLTVAEAYRQLKTWHINAGKCDIAGEFFYREMEAKRKALKWWRMPIELMLQRFLPWLRHTLYWLLCGYGEKPFRVVASASVVVVGLALTYFAIGTLEPNTLLNSLYYSAVSFTALGYGSWAPEPTGWVKGLGAFEAFVGVFMMALFLITFVRRLTR